MIERVGVDDAGHEGPVDAVLARDGTLDERLPGELVDVAGVAAGGVEELLDGVIAEQTLVAVDPLEMEVDVAHGVGEREREQPMRVADAGAQRLEFVVANDPKEVVGAREEHAEAVGRVHVVAGEPPNDVEDGFNDKGEFEAAVKAALDRLKDGKDEHLEVVNRRCSSSRKSPSRLR